MKYTNYKKYTLFPKMFPDRLPEMLLEMLPGMLSRMLPGLLPRMLPETLPEMLPEMFPEILPKFAFGPPSAELLLFLVDFCTPQKSLKNRIPQNTSQKLSKSTCFAPLAAQNRFLMIRVSILASFWHPFFIKNHTFPKVAKSSKTL